MLSKKIEKNEYEDLSVSSLPTRPTASSAFGGLGFSSAEMKAAFDKLPLFIIEKLNLLIEDLVSSGNGSAVGGFATGIKDGHTLADLFSDVRSGHFAEYLTVNGDALTLRLLKLENDIRELKNVLGVQ